MATSKYLSKYWTLVAASAALLIGGVIVGAVGPAWLGWHPDRYATRFVTDSGPTTRPPTRGDIQMHVKRLPPPDFPPDLADVTPDPRYARYDNIVVEVKPDGTLWVLGEQMGIDGFRSLLGDQIHDRLQTYVTIRPDDNCTYRYIGRIISMCQEVGVPHQMVVTPDGPAVTNRADAPA